MELPETCTCGYFKPVRGILKTKLHPYRPHLHPLKIQQFS